MFISLFFLSLCLPTVLNATSSQKDNPQLSTPATIHVPPQKVPESTNKIGELDSSPTEQSKLVKKPVSALKHTTSQLTHSLLNIITTKEPVPTYDSIQKLISHYTPIETFHALVNIVLKNPLTKDNILSVTNIMQMCCDDTLLEYAMKKAIYGNCDTLASVVSDTAPKSLTHKAVIAANILKVLPEFRQAKPVDEHVLTTASILQDKIIGALNALGVLSRRIPKALFKSIIQTILPGSITFAGAVWYEDETTLPSLSPSVVDLFHSRVRQLLTILHCIRPYSFTSQVRSDNFEETTYELAYYLRLITLKQCLDGLSTFLTLYSILDSVIGSFLGDQLIADMHSVLPYMPSLSDTRRVYGYVPDEVTSLAVGDYFSPSRSARIVLHNLYLQGLTDTNIETCLIDMMTIHMTGFMLAILPADKGITPLKLVYEELPIGSTHAFYAGTYGHAMIAKTKRNDANSFDITLINSYHGDHEYHEKITVGSKTLYLPCVHMPNLTFKALEDASYHFDRQSKRFVALKTIYANHKSRTYVKEHNVSGYLAPQASGTCLATSIIQYLHSSGNATTALRMKLAFVSHVIDRLSVAYDLYLFIQGKEKLSVDSLEERYSILKQQNAPLTYERYIWYRYRYILIISDALAGLLLENKNQQPSLALILNHWNTTKAHNPNDVTVQQIDENLESLIERFEPSHETRQISSHVPLTVSTTKEISEFEPEIPFAEQHAIAFANNILKACDPFNIVECFKVMISAMPYADF